MERGKGLADVVRLWSNVLEHGSASDPSPDRLEAWVTALDPERRPPPKPKVLPESVEMTSSKVEPKGSDPAPPTVRARRAPLRAPQMAVVKAEPFIPASEWQEEVRLQAAEVAEGLSGIDYEPLTHEPAPVVVLAPRSRWWPALQAIRRSGVGGVDVEALAAACARQGVPRRLPRRVRHTDQTHLHLLRDRARDLLPFEADFDALEKELKRRKVAARITHGRCFGDVPELPLPAGISAVLILSDFGASGVDPASAALRWMQWAAPLRARGVELWGWAPVAADRLCARLAATIHLVPWHELSRFKPTRGRVFRAGEPSPSEGELLRVGNEVKRLAAVTQRVEPALLRRLRRLAGGAGRPELEARLWHGDDDVAGGESVLQLREASVTKWRQAFAELAPALQWAVWKALEAQHSHLRRSTLFGERLIWGVHATEEARQSVGFQVEQARDWFRRLAAQEHAHTMLQAQRVLRGESVALHGRYVHDFLQRNHGDARLNEHNGQVIARLAVSVAKMDGVMGVPPVEWLKAAPQPADDSGGAPPRGLAWLDPSAANVMSLLSVSGSGKWIPGQVAWLTSPGTWPLARWSSSQPPNTSVSVRAHEFSPEWPAGVGELLLQNAKGAEVVYIAPLKRAPWQRSLGRDGHGVFCDVSIGRLTQTFRYIPPTTFLMGSPEGMAHSDEHPQHLVTITHGYWLSDTPCTQALWQAVMGGKNPSHFGQGADADDRPVDSVSWEGAQAFLAKFNALLPPGCAAELPTEAEWELACRAGTTTAYSWGDESDSTEANMSESGIGETTPVKRYPPNPWGLYDMHGNVWEWCADRRRTYEGRSEVNPCGVAGGGGQRVVRGGSWYLDANWARSAFRYRFEPGRRNHFQGFRFLLRSQSPASQAEGRELVLGARGAGDPGAGESHVA